MRKSWQGEPALVCDRPHCARSHWLRFTASTYGRLLLALWVVLVIIGVLATLAGCQPDANSPHPLRSGRQAPEQPVPVLTVVR